MSQSYQPGLYGSREITLAAVSRRLAKAILLPFEVLERQRWSAPWAAAQR